MMHSSKVLVATGMFVGSMTGQAHESSGLETHFAGTSPVRALNLVLGEWSRNPIWGSVPDVNDFEFIVPGPNEAPTDTFRPGVRYIHVTYSCLQDFRANSTVAAHMQEHNLKPDDVFKKVVATINGSEVALPVPPAAVKGDTVTWTYDSRQSRWTSVSVIGKTAVGGFKHTQRDAQPEAGELSVELIVTRHKNEPIATRHKNWVLPKIKGIAGMKVLFHFDANNKWTSAEAELPEETVESCI